jgi:hypothetical protein
MADFPGPFVLVPYGSETANAAAAALSVPNTDPPEDREAQVVCLSKNKSVTIKTKATPRLDSERWII